MSSYRVYPDGGLEVISPAVPTTETAACWLVVTTNGRFAITSNTSSDSLSTFLIDFDGSIGLRDSDGVTAWTNPGDNPLDSALTIDSHFLYALNSGSGGISGFRVESDGGLTPIVTGITGMPSGANGMAAW
ncbi:MAG: beta-propeller fold lactonase family protein [Acidobacteriota bacterium]